MTIQRKINQINYQWGDFLKGHIVVFRQLEKHGDVIGSMPSFNGYGSKEEIESEYELLILQEELDEYGAWNEIFELAKIK